MEEEGWLKDVLLDSWDIVVAGVAKEWKQMLKPERKDNRREWKLDSRTKLKSLDEGLQQFEDEEDAVLHFVKHAEYYLPRSDFNKTLEILLEKISKIRERSKDAADMKKQIQYLVGYVSWSLDSFVNILNLSKSDNEIEERVRNMINLEFSIAGAEEAKKDVVVNGLMGWKRLAEKRQGGH
jgi:hypothetical protein